jgi:hypothetical protein
MSYAEELLCESLRLVLHPRERVERNLRPDFLKNPSTGHNLELDFFLPRLSLGIEVQGPHHYTSDDQASRDETKRLLCAAAGVVLLELSIFQLRPWALRARLLDFSRERRIHVNAQPQTPAWTLMDERVAAYKSGILARFGPSGSYTPPPRREYVEQNEQLKRCLSVTFMLDGKPRRGQPIDFMSCKPKIRVRPFGDPTTVQIGRDRILQIS